MDDQAANSLDQLAAEGALALRRQVNGLITLLGKPAAWRDREPSEVARELVELLHELLRADLVALALPDACGDVDVRSPAEVAWSEIDAALRDGSSLDLASPNSVGKTAMQLVEARLEGDEGRIVVGSWRANFPTPGERLVLRAAADQFALAIQSLRRQRAQARLLEEEHRLRTTNARLARLQRIAHGLAAARTVEDVASTIAFEAAEAFGARGVALYALDDEARFLDLLTVRGSERLELRPARVAAASGVPIALALERRECIVSDAGVMVPLVVGNRAIGTLDLRLGGNPCDDAMLTAVANQAAQALDRARLLEAERRRRAAAEVSAHRLERLLGVVGALADALTPETVASVLVGEAVVLAGARSAGIWRRMPDREELTLWQRSGPDAIAFGAARQVRLDGGTSSALATCAMRAEPVWVERASETWLRESPLAHTGMSLVCLPLLSRTRVDSVLAFVFEGALPSENETRALLALLARNAGQSLERAGLYLEERRSRQEAQLGERRMALLAEASARLSSSHDYESALGGVAWLVVPRAADWCVVEIDEGGGSHLAAVAHTDVAKVDRVREWWSRGVGAAVRDVRSGNDAAGDATRTVWDAMSRDPELARIGMAIGVEGAIVVPIASRRGPLGTVAFGAADSGRTLGQRDVELAQELARRIGVTIDNARLYREARDADRRKEEFLAMLGHELRNPLAPIKTAVDLMRLKNEPAFERERAVIERHVGHMTSLVDDLLDVTRITSGKLELRRETLALEDVLRNAVEMASPLLERRMHAFHMTLGDGPLRVEGDRRRLAQIVSNLLQNAAKFTPEGGEVRLDARNERGRIVVRVRDSGIGIAPEMLDRVFDSFVQDQRSLDRAQGGLGLGLAIVRSLVQLHGGTVRAHSAGRGRGSEFIVTLPAVASEPSATVPLDAVPSAEPSAGAVRILVVDDNRDAADCTADLLRLYGYDVRVAYDGPQALAIAREHSPSVALLDIGLPIMDGYALAARFRGDRALAGVALIALTGYGQPEDRARTRAAGFVHHLVKPLSIDDALRAIAALVPATAAATG